MSVKYTCSTCKYSSNRQFNYDKHLLSNKHKKITEEFDKLKLSNDIQNLSKNKQNLSKNKQKGLCKCKYCYKTITRHINLKKHLEICKEKIKYELDNKLKETEIQLNKEKKEKIKLESLLQSKDTEILKKSEQTKKLIRELSEQIHFVQQENKDLTCDYNAFIKLVAEKNLDKPNITNNNNVCNIYYIMNNCQDALNYDDLMATPLTVSEINSLNNTSAIIGPYELLNDRCIKNIEFKNRPIHLVDKSRDKYCVKMQDNWEIDVHGETIKNELAKLVTPIYLNQNDNITIETMMSNNMKIKKFYDNRDKILNYTNKDILLRNNMKIIKK
jgi:hypothetical protein